MASNYATNCVGTWAMPQPKVDPEVLYHDLRGLISTMPDLAAEPIPSLSTVQWFGRAWARVLATGDPDGAAQLKSTLEAWQNGFRAINDQSTVAATLYRALGIAELNAPASVKGSFIPAGNAFDAMMGVGRVLQSATKSALIVDPYMDSKALEVFAVLAPECVAIQLLADQASHKPSLKPAVNAWIAQYGAVRPIEARLATPRSLHDRLIAIDGAYVWLLTQSLKDLAERSPATIARVDPETAALKMPAYEAMWQAATPI